MVEPWRHPPGEVGGWHPSGGGRRVDDAALPAGRPAVVVPPARMPMLAGGRPLKRWRYVGVFSPEAMISAASVGVGPLRQGFWAVWDRRHGTLDTETRLLLAGRVETGDRRLAVHSGDARIELALTRTGQPVEVVSPHGQSYIWTRKTPVRADGHFTFGMEVRPFEGHGLLDESAGYHARHTDWEWSAGVGVSLDGWPVTWNLVRGVHDADSASERTVWLNGRPREAPPVRFSSGLDEIDGADGSILRFSAEAVRSRRDRLGVLSSEYTSPFGRFSGTLAGGVRLSEQHPALGVMERHSARW